MEKKMKRKMQAVDVIVIVLLIVYACTLLLILGWGLLSSFKSNRDLVDNQNMFGLPDLAAKGAQEALLFGNYRRILLGFTREAGDASYYSSIFGYIENAPEKTFRFADYLFNSFLYSVICSFVHAFVAFTCAFLCAKYKFRFSEIVYVLMLIVMAIPIVGSSATMLTVLRDLGIYDTIFSMFILSFNFTGMYFFVFYAHVSGLSNTYMEAAEIDGASQLTVFIKIIFPLCAKVFFTVFLLQFIQTWNDYQTPLLYYPNHPTLAWAVIRVTRNTGGEFKGPLYQGLQAQIAGCMVLAIPIFILFVVFNKMLMGNLTMGGLKE